MGRLTLKLSSLLKATTSINRTKNKILNYNINIFYTQTYSGVNGFYLLF